MDFFTQHGGPLALQAIDGRREESGSSIVMHDRVWSRGHIIQIGGLGETEITGGPQSLDGMFGHGYAVSATASIVAEGFLGVVTSNAVLEDADGQVFVKGYCNALVYVDTGEALTYGDTLFEVVDQEYLAALGMNNGGTLGAARGVCMRDYAGGDLADDGTTLVEILFNGIPAFLG